MSTIYIRDLSNKEITTIVFGEESTDYETAVTVEKGYNDKVGVFQICDSGGEFVLIDSLETANNLILALRKAIELGWVK